MDWPFGTLVIVGMFVLRLGVPLAITLGVGYLWRRLDAKWQAEAQFQREASQAHKKVAAGPKPLGKAAQPCWSLKECDETVRARCPAPKQSDIPCWMARRRVEDRLPTECYDCELFSLRQIAQSRVG